MLTVEEAYLPVALTIPGITDEAFQSLVAEYADYRVEYTADGQLIIMPPTDPETGIRNSAINYHLSRWAIEDGSGYVTDSSTGFTLPSGARLSPDAAWISRARLGQKPTCPEFVIELLSPTDRPAKMHTKMLEWIASGVELAWMIDPRTRLVTIYRRGQEPEQRAGVTELAGEAPVAGFVLPMDPVWNPTR